jgi:hypothetical protein
MRFSILKPSSEDIERSEEQICEDKKIKEPLTLKTTKIDDYNFLVTIN